MKNLTFDPLWEKIFKTRNWGKYPPEELIRFIAVNFYHINNRKSIKILDLGCGTGACTWYLAREGFSVYGIDGSKTAIKNNRKYLNDEKLNAELVIGDISSLPWQESMFDAVIDIGCILCNTIDNTKLILKEIYRVLKPNGLHFSLTAKNGCWGDKTGQKIDSFTYNNVTKGPFSNMGMIRFSTKANLKYLYKDFKDIHLEYSLRTMNECRVKIMHWVLSCRK